MSKKKQKQPLESWHFTSDPLSVLGYRERDSWKKKHGKGKKQVKTSGVSKRLKNQGKKKQKQQKYYGPIGMPRKIKVFSGGLPSLGKKR